MPSVYLQTSTPASSFIVSSNAPDVVLGSSLVDSVSSDSIDSMDRDHKLPYR